MGDDTEYYLSLDTCPHGTNAIALNNGYGGTRLTRKKCCGRWNETHNFPMSIGDLRAALETFQEAVADAEAKEGNG